ncbi:MAG: methyltransferase domain-containing protein [Burkholderiales bacterium]|jgi:ubiquinone/menaquinone biosynthesis C-methylase UbiE|nr:methyltransferase domain-containing protein [Burkholderiales bacterium]
MSLRASYTLIAPLYDALVGPALDRVRRRSLARLPGGTGEHILLSGVGTGLDLPWLPACHHYTALDLTRAMLRKALPRGRHLDIRWVQGDSQRLPFADDAFDHALLHLILAIVPDTRAALAESARVVRPGGRLLVLDKFLRRGEAAWLRRLANPLIRRIATRTDVVLEDALAGVRGLRVLSDEPALAGGWFRMVTLEKTRAQDLPDSSGSSSSRRGQVSQTIPPSNATATAASIRYQSNPVIPGAFQIYDANARL